MSTQPESRAEQDVLDEIERSREEMLDYASRMVQTDTVTGHEGNAVPLLEAWLTANGLEAQVKPVADAVRDRRPSLRGEQRLAERPNVFGWLRARAPTGSGPVVLNGHVDTVGPGVRELWTHGPFDGVRADGRVWGRGAADMKGPLAAALYALRALGTAGVELPFDVQVQCVMGEESSGLGTIGALESEPRPAAAVVLEPSDCVVCPACGGSLQFEVAVEGMAAHAAVPWTGVSALDKALLVYDAITAFADQRNARLAHPLFDDLPQPAPYAIGELHAGEWRATVPDRAVIAGRLGAIPGEDLADVRAALADAVRAAAGADPWLTEHPPALRWVNEGYPAWETPRDHPLVAALSSAHASLFARSRPGAVTYGSDAGHFAAAGIPVVIFGPGRITDAHRENEYVEEEQIAAAARVLALALMRYRPSGG